MTATKALNAEIEDLRYLVRACEARIAKAMQVSTDDEYYEKQRLRLQNLIDQFQGQLDDLNKFRNNAAEIIASSDARKTELQEEIRTKKHGAQIAKLMEMQRVINELKGEEDGP